MSSDHPLDHAAIGQLYHAHHAWLRGWLSRRTGCREHAADLAQETFVRLLNARLALLSRQTAIAASDLQEVEATVPRYFDANSRKTQLLRSMLVDVAKQSTQTTVPRPDDTFAALAAVSAGR